MQHGGSVGQNYHEDTKPLFQADNDSVEYWTQNHMNWTDVSDKATLISTGKCDHQRGWICGPTEIK